MNHVLNDAEPKHCTRQRYSFPELLRVSFSLSIRRTWQTQIERASYACPAIEFKTLSLDYSRAEVATPIGLAQENRQRHTPPKMSNGTTKIVTSWRHRPDA